MGRRGTHRKGRVVVDGVGQFAPTTIELQQQSQHDEAAVHFVRIGSIVEDLREEELELPKLPQKIKEAIEQKVWYRIYIQPLGKYVAFDKHRLSNGELDHQANFLDWVRASHMDGGLHYKPEKLENLLKNTEAWEVYTQLMSQTSQESHTVSEEKADQQFPNSSDNISNKGGKLPSKNTLSTHRAIYGDGKKRFAAPMIVRQAVEEGLLAKRLAVKLNPAHPTQKQQEKVDRAVGLLARLVEHTANQSKTVRRRLIREKLKSILEDTSKLNSQPIEKTVEELVQQHGSNQLKQIIQQLRKKLDIISLDNDNAK